MNKYFLLAHEDPARLPDAIDKLDNDDLVDTFHYELWRGSVSLARKMLPRYQSLPETYRSTRLTDEFFQLTNDQLLSRSESMEDVIEAIQIASSIWFFNPLKRKVTPFLISTPLLKKVYYQFLPSYAKPFDGDLPMVDAQGFLHHPELALGLRSIDRAHPQAYDHVLCWVADELSPDELPGTRFEREQSAHIAYMAGDKGKSDKLQLEDMNPDQWREIKQCSRKTALEDSSVVDERVNLQVLNCHLSVADGTPISADVHCLKTMAPLHCLYGFEEKKGYTLSRVSVSDILALPQAGYSHINAEKSALFLGGYLPLLIITEDVDQKPLSWLRIDKLGISSDRVSLATNSFKALNAAPKVKEKLLALLPEDAWRSFLSPYTTNHNTVRPNVTANTLIDAWNHFGWNNEGIYLHEWSYIDIAILHENNFVFSPDTYVMFDNDHKREDAINARTALDMSSSQFNIGEDQRIKTIRRFIDMQLWPVRHKEKPADIYSTLKSAARLSDRRSDYAYSLDYLLEKAGVEACCACAKTDKQWETVSRLFGEDISPFMSKAPAKIRKHTISQGLGL